MRIAASVIVYHPDTTLLQKNIAAFIDDVETVLIYRNSPDVLSFPKEWERKIIYLGNGQNRYIAGPLNECLEWCEQHNIDFLLTMDQDSLWDHFHGFCSVVQANHHDDIVIHAPNVNHQLPNSQSVKEIESTITSGSLTHVKTALKLGGFKEEYKIYWVDGEFCHRARLKGYKIQGYPQYHLQQRFGDELRTKWGGYFCANYSSESYYFMFRNMLFMKREWHSNPSIKCIFYTLFIYLRSILLGESNKMKKTMAIAKGLINGMTCKIESGH